MRITEEQNKFLDGLICERLSSNPQNKELIKKFTSERGELLVKYLQTQGWEQDLHGEIAYYLIKYHNDLPILFFSLKCGALFEPMDDTRLLEQINIAEKKLNLLVNEGLDNDLIRERIIELIKEYNLTPEQAIKVILNQTKKTKRTSMEQIKKIAHDKVKESGRPILRVQRTMPGVVLEHFCSNDLAKPEISIMFKEMHIQHSVGEVLFWSKIVDIIEKLQSLVGCQYLFLFAADSTRDESLINYYDVSLKFSREENIGTSKPLYDLGCVFMSQNLETLKENRKDFFNNFNLDDNDDIV